MGACSLTQTRLPQSPSPTTRRRTSTASRGSWTTRGSYRPSRSGLLLPSATSVCPSCCTPLHVWRGRLLAMTTSWCRKTLFTKIQWNHCHKWQEAHSLPVHSQARIPNYQNPRSSWSLQVSLLEHPQHHFHFF